MLRAICYRAAFQSYGSDVLDPERHPLDGPQQSRNNAGLGSGEDMREDVLPQCQILRGFDEVGLFLLPRADLRRFTAVGRNK